MAEPPDSFEALLAQADQVSMPRRGDLLRGVILSTDARGAIVDLGLKRDGVIPRVDLDRVPPGDSGPQVGDKVAVMVVDPLDEEGNLVVSLAQARESGDWLDAQRAALHARIRERRERDLARDGEPFRLITRF